MTLLKTHHIFLFILTVFFASCISRPSAPTDFKVEVPQFIKPKVSEWTLTNGLKIVHFYYPELPLVNVSLISKRGRLYSTDFNDGTKTATISLLKDGGAGALNPEQLDEKLDSLATGISIGQDNNATSIEMNCLSDNLGESFNIFSDVLFRPRFDESRLMLWKSLVADGISRRKDSKESLAQLSFSKVIFNGEAPWYAPLTESSLKEIKVPALKEYHKSLLSPSDSVLIFVGAIEESQIKELLNKEFNGWQSSNGGKEPAPLKLPDSLDPGIYVLNSDFAQSEVEMGYILDKSASPDPYEEALFNKSFGQGSFSSLLFQEIRDKLGLAYDLSGGFESDKNMDLFKINIGTKSEQVLKSIEEILNLLKRIREEGIPEDSLEQARTSALQTYIFKFSNPDILAKRDTLIELYGLPKEWDQVYQSRISSIKGEQIKALIEKYVNPDDLKIIIVGRISSKAVKEKFKNKKVCELEFSDLPKVKECL